MLDKAKPGSLKENPGQAKNSGGISGQTKSAFGVGGLNVAKQSQANVEDGHYEGSNSQDA